MWPRRRAGKSLKCHNLFFSSREWWEIPADSISECSGGYCEWDMEKPDWGGQDSRSMGKGMERGRSKGYRGLKRQFFWGLVVEWSWRKNQEAPWSQEDIRKMLGKGRGSLKQHHCYTRCQDSLSQENPLQADQVRVPALSLCDLGQMTSLL